MSARTKTKSEIFDWASEKHKTYKPNKEIKAQLVDKIMVPLVGPTAVGKSFLAKRVTELDATFSEMATITTRASRPNDPDHVIADVDMDDFAGLIEAGELVQFEPHESGNLYGTTPDCYIGNKIIAPILSTGVETYQQLGFKQVTPMGIVAPSDTWGERLRERAEGDDYIDRLQEARKVLKWMQIYMHSIPILNNETNHGAEAASEIILLTENPTADNLGALRKRGFIVNMQNHVRRELMTRHGQ
ncbi:MAG: hypothetical protein Q7T74_01150 [Candidatus Saccharibacteria bacterium]|nr:hypothetical protein [Candidatus Saccharibacteria bacterium]